MTILKSHHAPRTLLIRTLWIISTLVQISSHPHLTFSLVPKKLKNEGPSYLEKKDYGKTPEYLKQRIIEMKEAEINFATRLANEKNEKETMTLESQGIVLLPDEERERILKGLQDNWEKLNKDYQRLSLTVDTVPKIARFDL